VPVQLTPGQEVGQRRLRPDVAAQVGGVLGGRDGGYQVVGYGQPADPKAGCPAGAQFPRAAWLRSAQRALTELPDADLGYGDPAGYSKLRSELSAYLGRVRALIAPPERIVIVNGFGQASRLLAEVLAGRGIDEIGLEDAPLPSAAGWPTPPGSVARSSGWRVGRSRASSRWPLHCSRCCSSGWPH
jgi:DNA-binding transcriptional MocR family regulator